MTGDGPKMVHSRPNMAKHGRLVNVRSKVVQKGPNGTKMVNWSGPFGTLLGLSGPFWNISDKKDFLPQMDKIGFGGGASEQKIIFCFEWSDENGCLEVPKPSYPPYFAE